MKPSLLFRILAWIVILFSGILAGCSGDALERTPSNPSNITRAAEHPTHTPGSATSSPKAEGSATPPNTPTPFSLIAPYHLISPSEFSFDFTMDAQIPPGQYIVVAEDSYTFDPEMQIRVITYSGDEISTLDVERTNKGKSFPTTYVTQIHTDSNLLLIEAAKDLRTKELYVYDFQTSSTWGIEQECESLIGLALGAKYLAFNCLEDLYTWHLVSTADPLTNYSFRIAMPNDRFDAIWVGPNEILFKGERESFCLGSIPDWDPICGDIPYWPGRLATDVDLLEIREGRPENPTAIGALSTTCLRSNMQGCDPILIKNPFPNLQQPWSLHSSWVPGTTSILYLKLVDHDLSTFAFDETELWLATYPEGVLALLDVLEGEVFLTELEFPNAPAIWLSNGQEVILNKLNELIVYNLETGEQRSIGDPGTVLGTITIE